jgi:mycothiol synthase
VLTRAPLSWKLELADDGRDAESQVRQALAHVAAEGGGPVNLWISRPTHDDDDLAAQLGFRPDRDLLQMRRPLPLDTAADVTTRPFEPGRDEAAWVAVNNRAFAGHPEQGAWDVDTLLERERQPWFDPEGFLLHERDGRLAAFCWTKVHADHAPPVGEIYVIAVDPDFHGLGLGKALTVAGLQSLAERGLTAAMLYVDAANTAAVGLYKKLGFTVDHVDRAYRTELAPTARPTA